MSNVEFSPGGVGFVRTTAVKQSPGQALPSVQRLRPKRWVTATRTTADTRRPGANPDNSATR